MRQILTILPNLATCTSDSCIGCDIVMNCMITMSHCYEFHDHVVTFVLDHDLHCNYVVLHYSVIVHCYWFVVAHWHCYVVVHCSCLALSIVLTFIRVFSRS
jgi:hypothetical protein